MSSPEVRGSDVDSSWNSLYKIGGITAMLSGVFAVMWAIAPVVINHLPYSGSTYENFLSFVQANSAWYYLWYSAEMLAVILALPTVLALYFVLSRTDKGVALVGVSVTILAIVLFLSSEGLHFYLVQEAGVYNGGCTICAQEAVTGGIATTSAGSSDNIASFVTVVGVLILSLLMFKTSVMGKVPASLGIVFGAYSLVNSFVLSQGNGEIFFYLGQVPLVILAIWLFAVGAGVFRAGQYQKPV